MFLGDYRLGDTIGFHFSTRGTNGPATLSGTPSLAVRKAGSTSPTTGGVTLVVDRDSVTGLNYCEVNTATDTAFFSAEPYQVEVVVAVGTVDDVSVVGEVVGRFTLRAPDANVAQIDGDATAASRLASHAKTPLIVVVGPGSTATAVVFKTVNGAAPSATNGKYAPGALVFITGALAGERQAISGYTGGTTLTAAVDAFTEAAAEDDIAVLV